MMTLSKRGLRLPAICIALGSVASIVLCGEAAAQGRRTNPRLEACYNRCKEEVARCMQRAPPFKPTDYLTTPEVAHCKRFDAACSDTCNMRWGR
jgi:hypothetical protein